MKNKVTVADRITTYQDEIHKRNCESFQSFALGGTVITFSVVVFGLVFSRYTRFVHEYIYFFAYMLLLCFVAKYCNRHKVTYIRGIYYLSVAPIYVGVILMGTFFDAENPAITFMILFCVLMLFLIDYPWRMYLFQAGVVAFFILCCFLAKDEALFRFDMINMGVYASVSFGVSFFILKDRIASAENFVLVQEKSERDAMTTLLNRGAGESRMRRLIDTGIRGSFIIFDVDDFKHINDTYGHQVGDEVICEVAAEICDSFQPSDIIWRLGGDEFAVYAVGLTDRKHCSKRFYELQRRLSSIKTSNEKCSSVGISIGCTICREGSMGFENLYRSSDKALYHVKDDGKGKYEIVEA